MISRRLLLTAAGAAALVGTPVWATETDPDAWILEMSNKILNDIRGNAKLAAADPAEVKKFVDNVVMPAVDFLRMTRMAVGPKWRQATAEQRTELQRLFRAQLTNVYSGALATVKDQTVKLAPNRVKPTETDAVVRTLLVSPGKPDMHINYRLKKVNGEWRIIDVDVEGIWLFDNYRNQFASVVNTDGIEGLIKSLREKVGEAK